MIDVDKNDFEPLDRCRVLSFQFAKFAEKVKEILLLYVKAKDVCIRVKVNRSFQLEFSSRAAWICLKIPIADGKWFEGDKREVLSISTDQEYI